MLEIEGVLDEMPEFKRWKDSRIPSGYGYISAIYQDLINVKRKPRWIMHSSGNVVIRCCVKGKYYDIFVVEDELIYSAVPYKTERFYTKADSFDEMYDKLVNIAAGVYSITPEQYDYVVTLLERSGNHHCIVPEYMNKINSTNIAAVISHLKSLLPDEPTSQQITYAKGLIDTLTNMGCADKISELNLNLETKIEYSKLINILKNVLVEEKQKIKRNKMNVKHQQNN